MKKSLIEILAEKDQEHVYHVHSTANIHDPEICERIKLAFLPFDVKSCECDGYKPLAKSNPTFPAEPNSPTYSIKVVTNYPITKNFVQSMALDARINLAHIKIETDEDPLDPVNGPEEESSDKAQKLVGTKRIGEFIKELQKDRKAREDMTATREVYESFYTTHRGLEKIVQKPLRNGYYMVEAYREDGKNYLRAEGPFSSRPEGNPYYDRVKVNNSQVISESTVGDKYGVNLCIEEIEKK